MSSRPRRAVRRALTATVPVTALLTLAACGSGATPAADSTQAAAPGSPGLTAARAALAKYSERPATISVTQPVGKPIPKGKKSTSFSAASSPARISPTSSPRPPKNSAGR